MAAKPTVVVFSASSNTGESAIKHLLESGKVNVRAVVRSMGDKDADFEAAGVEYILGDIAKKQVLKPVFEGVSSAYFATPATKDRAKLGCFFVDACFEHGVEHAVIISHVGTETKTTSYHKQFAEIEEYAMSRAGQPVKAGIADRGHLKFSPTIIRSAQFYQNIYGVLSSIKTGHFYYPLGHTADAGELCHVDLNDVGKAIATVLEQPGEHAGKAYNIIGESQTGNQISSIIGMKAGRQCAYMHVDEATCVEAFSSLGFQPWIAAGNVEMIKFCREGGCSPYGAGDFAALTGGPPERFGTFVKDSLKPLLL